MNTTTTDFLMANSTFLTGMATTINLGGNFYEYNRSETPAEADAYALGADWSVVGKDIRDSIERERTQD